MKTALFIIALFLFSGCSTKITPPPPQKVELKQLPITVNVVEYPYKPKSNNWITLTLFDEYKKWYQTPYEYGGVCHEGVDCSSLIQNIYKDAFNITLPRSSKEQANLGYKVSKNSMKEGDLVFFKINHNLTHVGVIIEQGKFINSSTSCGVTVSELNSPYWREKYWQSRRVLSF